MMILNLSESLAKPLVMAKLNMAYLSSLKNRAKLLLSSLPVSPSRVLRAPGTSSYHLVPKHLRATRPRPEQSHLLPEACSPNGTDNRQQRQRQKFGQKWVKQKIEIFLGSRISKFLRPAQRYDDFKLIRITCQAACHGKTEHGICSYVSSLKNRAKLLLSSLPVSPSRVLRAPGTSSYHLVPKHLRATRPRPEQSHLLPEACSPNGTDNRQQRQRQKFGQKWVKQKIEIFLGSRISKFLRPAQRYDDFKLIRITCQAACHGKTEHGICSYVSSLKNRAKLLLSSLPVSPSRVLRAPGTSSYHLVPKHLRATRPRPEQSHLLPEACSPNGTDNRQQRQRQTERPPPEPSDILKRFDALYDIELRYFMKKVSKLYYLFNPF